MSKILIIEDDIDIAHMEANALSSFGHDVTIFEISLLPSIITDSPWKDIQIALVDLRLPNIIADVQGNSMDNNIQGDNILIYLKQNHPHIRRILKTASTKISANIVAMADFILYKPYTLKKLKEVCYLGQE